MASPEQEKEIRDQVQQGIDKKLPGELDKAFEQMPSHKKLRKTGWIGAGVLTAGIVGGGILGYNLGSEQGAQDERGRIFPSGELSPQLRDKLVSENHLVVDVDGWTSVGLREIGIRVPDFPLDIPDGVDNPEITPSTNNFLAIKQEGIYLTREEEDTVKDLTTDIRAENSAAKKIDESLGFVEGSISDFIEAEIASLRETNETIFKEGFVATKHRIDVGEGEDQVTHGIAIGRATPLDEITLITFEAASDAPLPPNVSAGGFITAK